MGHPPSSGYGYPPGGYPPSSYPPAGGAGGPRPSWPPHSGYMGGPPPPGSAPDGYGRPGWSQPPSGGYSPRPPYPPGQGGPPTTASGSTSQSQPYSAQPPYQDPYQTSQQMNYRGAVSSTEQGRPVILSANSSTRPENFAHKQGYNNTTPPSSTASGGYPAPPGSSSKSAAGQPSSQPPRPGMPPYQGQRPPMYPGQPQWQNRYPAPGPGGYGPQPGDRTWTPPSGPGTPPRGPGPQWSGDRASYYGSSGAPESWNKMQMRPPYRPDMRGPGQMSGPQRPGYPGSRRDMSFPPGCVESTPPYMLKRRKYTKGDVQPVDGWRLVMALKSGLLMESTWALDALNILLYDDNGVLFFGLGNMPGLLEALLEHWRASLIAMFGIMEDLELNTDQCGEKRTRKRRRDIEEAKNRVWFEKKKCLNFDLDEDELNRVIDLGKVKDIDPEDKRLVLTEPESTDFTKKPRFVEEEVHVHEGEDELFVTDENRTWDSSDAGFESGMSHWLNGGGNTTSHIVTHFSADLGKAVFTRLIKDAPTIKPKKEKAVKESQKSAEVKLEVNGDCEGIKHEISADESVSEEVEAPEDIVDKIYRLTGITLKDPELARNRWNEANLEDENYVRDEPSLQLISETNDSIGKRAVCISTILRNLSFVPGNEYELSKNPSLMAMLGRLLLLQHWYPVRAPKQRNYDRGEEEESAESCTSLTGDDEWWWEYLHVIRENVLVILANISGAVDLEIFEEEISRPILDGLLEWAVSSSAYAQDPFPNVGPGSSVSPQRCAIEALCKFCLLETNVDLMLSTPPFSRLEKLIKLLAKKLYRFEDQVLREFSINLLYYLSQADTGVSRIIALSDTTISLLLSFIEQAEQNALVIAQQHGVNALRDNPDSMGTSLDMLRRAANTLSNLSQHPDNIALLVRQEQRLLNLVMSQILDQGVASILSQVLFNIGANSAPPPVPPSLPPTPPPAPAKEESEQTSSTPAAKEDAAGKS